MTGSATASDFDRVDAYRNTAADYDEVPDMADADPALVTWHVGGEPVAEAEARAAMADTKSAGVWHGTRSEHCCGGCEAGRPIPLVCG